MPEIQLQVPDMACGACAAAIETAVQTVDPQAQVQADPSSKRVTVTTTCPAAEIQSAIAAAGYHPELA
ncbi:heavy-metal-associated domain-containing protein [Synechococcus elongatus]|uniref:Heavy-metal-associated domain-containing protein n=1 Tax=Synechococcus elongatus PCC 11802 TaxID=2283154 RepID=A0AAT9K067_SYNEL|nr:heavy-metal-associated domain-containing protein [Synechococcus elongatus]QFZ93180.1 copper chaperone [Synechococcus elongatus PCC 11802]